MVVTSRCFAGPVLPEYGGTGGGRWLADEGAILAGDLPTNKARLALSVALGADPGADGRAGVVRGAARGRLMDLLVPGVYAQLADEPGHGATNAGVVVDDDGVTVVDTLMVPSQWEPFAAAVDGARPARAARRAHARRTSSSPAAPARSGSPPSTGGRRRRPTSTSPPIPSCSAACTRASPTSSTTSSPHGR